MIIEIRNGRLIASVVLILLGFCAGAGLNLLPNSSTVHGAPGEPNSALKNVAHDGTLGGEGTVSAPLGIANGGVSAPKLSTAAPPSLGQVLGFNGANLAWQNAPAGGVRVVDSLGHDVGPLLFNGESNALRAIGGVDVALDVRPQGFVPMTTTDSKIYFPTPDCSGPGYLIVDPGSMFSFPSSGISTAQSGLLLTYPAEPIQQITLQSFHDILALPQSHVGPCESVGFQANAGMPATIDLTTLGLVPPFHLQL